MDSMLNLVLNSNNWQVALLAVLGFCGFVIMRSQMKDMKHSLSKQIDGVESSLSRRIDNVESSLGKRIDNVESSLNKQIDDLRHNDLAAIHRRIDDIKYNDFAHLNNAMEALIFTLEKNGSLTAEDREFVSTRLAH